MVYKKRTYSKYQHFTCSSQWTYLESSEHHYFEIIWALEKGNQTVVEEFRNIFRSNSVSKLCPRNFCDKGKWSAVRPLLPDATRLKPVVFVPAWKTARGVSSKAIIHEKMETLERQTEPKKTR